MKIVFLDMDEVLCTDWAHQTQNGGDRRPHPQWPFRCALDPVAVAWLNQSAPPDVKYVSCSTWRINLTKDDLTEHLRHWGWTGEFHEDWRTTLANWMSRGEQISAWLKAHPEVTVYAIVDDNPEAGIGHPEDRFVLIRETRTGFSEKDADALAKAFS